MTGSDTVLHNTSDMILHKYAAFMSVLVASLNIILLDGRHAVIKV